MAQPIASSEDEDSVDSADALCAMLGISSLDAVPCDGGDDDDDDHNDHDDHRRLVPILCQSMEEVTRVDDQFILEAVAKHKLKEIYDETSICIFPGELSVPAAIMRRMTDELVWSGDKVKAERMYESIKVWKDGVVYERPTLTRLENLNGHESWNQLCNNYIRRCLSAVLGVDMVLYKTKLNLKPAGGSGFAPHVDAPSLRVALGDSGPQTFVTVMCAIDSMTHANGCLRIAEGRWGENACPTITPIPGASPDAGGRAGAIPLIAAETMNFVDVICAGGALCAFTGWAPHRSGANQSNIARRAVFLTYNPASEGDFYDAYYERMAQIRNDWRASAGMAPQQRTTTLSCLIDPIELEALTTIPRF